MHYQRFRKHGDPLMVKVSATSIKPGQVLNPLGGRAMMGDAHPNWKGVECGYVSAHYRVVARRGRAAEYRCVDCGAQAAEWSYNHEDVTHERVHETPKGPVPYSPWPEFYSPRCKSCHAVFDGGRVHV